MSSKPRLNPKRKAPWAFQKEVKRHNYDREEDSTRYRSYRNDYQEPRNSFWRGRFQNRPSKSYDRPSNLGSLFDYDSPRRNRPSQEQDQETAESAVLENERREKILATKKRIEEALASTKPSSQDINLADSQKTIEIQRDKSFETNACIKEGVGLRLTNSDFKEIGSVESGVASELDASDMIINVSPVIAQKRSFDSTLVNVQVIPPPAKTRVEGWTMSSTNEITPQTHQRLQDTPNPTSTSLNPNRGSQNVTYANALNRGVMSDSTRKVAGEMFLQESREEILGRIDPVAARKENVERPPPKPSQPRRDFAKVGNLYQSFLRTRLFGYTYRQRIKTIKQLGPNPLLNKSVLENQNTEVTSRQQNTILEIQMPRPILIKSELDDAVNAESIEQEANEFCKEYSYLLTDPNLLIPSENLEKLGLGHLSEMNDLVSKRSDNVLTSPSSNQDQIFRVRSLSSDSGKDLVMEQPAKRSTQLKETIPNNSGSNLPRTSSQINNSTDFSGPGVSVNTIADKVVEKLFSTLSNNPSNQQLNVQSLLQRQGGGSTDNNHGASSETMHSSSVKAQPPADLVQTISSYILKIFLIDKQIEELSQEKMKIYSELLSIKDISISLFSSWAQEQITKGNVVNCQMNQSNIIPQMMRLNGITNHNEFLEALAPGKYLKKEDPKVLSMTNGTIQDTVSSSHLEFPGCSTPPATEPEVIRPKLSVRKDLHDHGIQNSSLNNEMVPLEAEAGQSNVPDPVLHLDPLTEIPRESCFVKVEGAPQSFISFETAETNNPVNKQEVCDDRPVPKKKNKKKKDKKKKESVVEVVDLLDSTEEESVVSFEPSDPLEIREPSVNKKSTNVKFTFKETSCSVEKTPTCIRIVNRKNVSQIYVGSKEGFLMVFNAVDGQLMFEKKIHQDSITCLTVYKQRFAITGSLDSTVCVFSAKKQETILSFEVGAPILCCYLRMNQEIFFGTKDGQLAVYKLTPNGEAVVIAEVQPKMQLTDSSILALVTGQNKTLPQNEIVVASRGQTVTIRDIKTGEVLHELDWCDTVKCFVIQHKTLYCGTTTRSIRAFNIISRKNEEDCTVGRCVITMVPLCHSIILAACKDCSIYAVDVQEKRLIATIPTQITNQLIQSIASSGQMIFVISSNSVSSIAMPEELVNYIKGKKQSAAETT